MLLTFNNILPPYYALQPIHSLDNKNSKRTFASRSLIPSSIHVLQKWRMSLTGHNTHQSAGTVLTADWRSTQSVRLKFLFIRRSKVGMLYISKNVFFNLYKDIYKYQVVIKENMFVRCFYLVHNVSQCPEITSGDVLWSISIFWVGGRLITMTRWHFCHLDGSSILTLSWLGFWWILWNMMRQRRVG